MPRAALLLMTLACAARIAPAAEPTGEREAAALQALVQRAIARAEPSIACILVSRSDQYRLHGAAPGDPESGKLGRFTPGSVLVGVTDPDERRRRTLLSLDLSHPDHVPESYGSGVVIDETGLILTCAHVVRGATKVYIRLPGNRGSWADIHAADPRSDLAVLRPLDRIPDLKPLPLGDATGVKKGQFVVSMANPFAAGFRDGSPSASWGIVSNVRRRAPGAGSEIERTRQSLHQFGTLLQTDVRLNLGSSGGALLDLRGELIGITTALAALSGSETPGGFAIPLDAGMRRVVEKLRRGEEVEYGFLGVSLDPSHRNGQGARIQSVSAGSPAERAGLRAGEVIVGVNGAPIRENDDLFLHVGIQMAGANVRLETAPRAGAAPRTTTARLAKFLVHDPVIASSRPPAHGGLRVDYTSILSQRPGLPIWHRGVPEGVAIREVLPGSAADRARLQSDKIITRVNGKPVATPDDYYRVVQESPGRIELTFLTSDGREDRVTLDGRIPR